MAWAPDYATLSELKSWLRISDTVDDVEIETIISAASRAIDSACGRQFGKVETTEARDYTARYVPGTGWLAEIDDLHDVSGFTLLTSGDAITPVEFAPKNALAKGRVYTRVLFDSLPAGISEGSQIDVTATGAWGWPEVPRTVLQALKLQSSRLLARRDSPLGIAGSPDQGSELRLLARLDPDVELLLRGYVRRNWIVG